MPWQPSQLPLTTVAGHIPRPPAEFLVRRQGPRRPSVPSSACANIAKGRRSALYAWRCKELGHPLSPRRPFTTGAEGGEVPGPGCCTSTSAESPDGGFHCPAQK